MLPHFDLGSTLRDTVTGFEGVATGRVEYINGCVQYAIAPPVDKDGKLQDAHYFDAQRLRLVGAVVDVPASPTGADTNTPATNYRG